MNRGSFTGCGIFDELYPERKGPPLLAARKKQQTFLVVTGMISITPSRGPAGTKMVFFTPPMSSCVTSKPKSGKVVVALISASLRSFTFLALAQLLELIVGRHGPQDEGLSLGSVFQFVKAHLYFGRFVFMRLDENVRSRT